jgi:hypothetical protein
MAGVVGSVERARAFALEAQADFKAHELLAASSLPDCQQLHFLQMACEKVCKAHLFLKQSDPLHVESSHAYIGSVLPLLIRQMLLSQVNVIANKDASVIVQNAKSLCREIELLSPAVDDNGNRKDNCEYPWVDAKGILCIPAQHDFESLRFLKKRFGRVFLRLVTLTIDELAGE